ncbi:PREDICTED: uncharacterized protein LOC108447907 [Corvus brachyrhynchos]|uniref:uncharacterized protein LOC108447907 n=1 Tax=Corvus brachyrhynchos TaxID=85066 RepID=UPI0008163597|nr:PREDICTED: uncharacterized protein LOC108447907 [Corvus brachyrhynchos]
MIQWPPGLLGGIQDPSRACQDHPVWSGTCSCSPGPSQRPPGPPRTPPASPPSPFGRCGVGIIGIIGIIGITGIRVRAGLGSPNGIRVGLCAPNKSNDFLGKSLGSSLPQGFGVSLEPPRGLKEFGVQEFGIKEFGIQEFGIWEFGIREFGIKEFRIQMFGVREFGIWEFGIREFGVQMFGIQEFGIQEFGIKSIWDPEVWGPGIWDPGMKDPNVWDPGVQGLGVWDPGIRGPFPPHSTEAESDPEVYSNLKKALYKTSRKPTGTREGDWGHFMGFSGGFMGFL